MAKELKRSLGSANLRVRLWTLKDKDSLFRAKEPDVHIVELEATAPGDDDRASCRVIVMSKEYEDYVLARSHYENFLLAFGLPRLPEPKQSP